MKYSPRMDLPARQPRAAGRTNAPARLLVAVTLVVMLTLASLLSYVLFHTLAEILFSVTAFSVMVMAWTLRSFLDDDFPVFLGIALGAAGLLHLLHMADFPGVNMVTGSMDPPTQLWIAARLLIALSMVLATFVLGRRLRLRLVGIAYLAVDALIVASIYWWDVFPATLQAGTGLTQFKVASEYVVCALFAVAVWLLWRKRRLLPRGAYRLLTAALVASIAAELFFTLYDGPHQWPNLVGHVFLALSAVLVYAGAVEDGLARPHELAVAGLREAQQLHRRLERGLLPRMDLRRDDVSVLVEYRLGERHLELGGDFLDVVDLGDDGLAVICGDVSGHGPDAAALATMLRVSWEALVLSGTPPPALVGALHDVLVRERVNADTFATLCLAWVQPASDTIELLTLGHPLPLVVADGVRQLEAMPEPPLGVLDAPGGVPVRLQLPDGWRLLFYTDGLIEGHAAPGAHERFGEERLIAALERLSGLDRESIAELVETIERLGGEPFADDVTVAVIGKR